MRNNRLKLLRKMLLGLILEWGILDWISFLQSQSMCWQDWAGTCAIDNLFDPALMVWWSSSEFEQRSSTSKEQVKSDSAMRFKSSVTVKYLAYFKILHLKIWKVGKLSKANSWEEVIFVCYFSICCWIKDSLRYWSSNV